MKSGSSKPSALEAEQQLARILASPGFVKAERLGRFLQFVVNQSLEGKAGELKETLIGVEVYGRRPDYDPRADSIVRMEASRLRSRLQEYYADGGAADAFVIDLPKGGYAPVICVRQSKAKPSSRGWIAAALIASVLAAGFWFRWPSDSETLPVHFLVSPPEGTRVALRMPNKALASISPDGKNLVLVAEDKSGQRSLWLRSLKSIAYQHLDQTEGASEAFWSPDSQKIGFIAEGKLKKIPLTGGPAQTICDVAAGDGEGASWSSNGKIIFAPPRPQPAALPQGALSWVSGAGGSAQPATSLDKDGGELSHSWPQFLPDGRHFLYLARNKDPGKSGVYVQELGSQKRALLLTSKTQASYARGPGGAYYLLYPRDLTLLAQPLNLSRLEISGEPVPVAAGVSYNTLYGTTTFSVSNNGVLAYRTGRISSGSSPIRKLSWYNRRGDRISSIGEPGLFAQLALSPDESRVAVDRNTHQNDVRYWDIWTIDLASGVFSRLTKGSHFRLPVWSPDSRKIAAVSQEGDGYSVVEIPLSSGSPAILAHAPSQPFSLESWTPDGRSIFFSTRSGSFRLPLLLERRPQPVLNAEVFGGRARVSPDGRWIAYQSAESGRSEVYVRAFPSLDQERQISNGGGAQPLWSKDGRELYYLTLNTMLVTVEVKSGAKLETGNARPLFQTPIEGNPLLAQYAVSADGQRFLMMENSQEGAGPAGAEQFHVESNWFAAMNPRVP
jgi:eukaryotic-like serine/threonine-protein kinase